jgi:hypothetical protein
MAQSYPDIPATDSLSASRQKLLDRDDALKSNFSGTAFPTTGLVVGMTCFRTDQNKLYMLKDTVPTWLEIANVAGSANIAVNSDMVDGYHANTGTTASTVPVRNAGGEVPGNITGNAATATTLQTSRNIALTGDATGSASFNGSANANIALTLANTTVTPGSYQAANVTVDAKGRITGIAANPSIVASFNGRSGAVSLIGSDLDGLVLNNDLRIAGSAPTVHLRDTDNRVAFVHVNANNLYFLSGDPNAAAWSQVNNQWPLYLDLSNNNAVFGANIVTGTYGWLHDYFFNAVSNCLREGFYAGNNGNCSPGEQNVVNCYGSGNITGFQRELVDNGGSVSLRTVRYYYNCNCVCDSGGGGGGGFCDCSCVPTGTLVRMANGHLRAIESIKVGDELWGGGSVVNTRAPLLGKRALWEINGQLQVTGDHLIRTKRIGWACVEPALMQIREAYGIAPAVAFTGLRIGDEVLTCDGWVEVASIEKVPAPESLQLHTLYVEGTGAFFAEGFCVDGILTPQKLVLPAIEGIPA